MVELFKTMLEALKLSPRKLVAIAAVLGLLLFAKPEWREFLGVGALVQDYRAVIGIGFAVAVCLLIVELLVLGARKVQDIRAKWYFERRARNRLRCLSEDEKQILRFYIAQNTRSNSLRIDDGVVQGLASAGLISQVGSFGNALDGFAFNVADFVWDELQKHPDLLTGDTNTYRTDRAERFW